MSAIDERGVTPRGDAEMTTLTKVATRDHDRCHVGVMRHATMVRPPRASLEANFSAASAPYNAVRTEKGV
ncbi:hypothetical protein SAMN04489712_104285 [Thermomonospora echinospora]|uniref:Uncharacterized protein n=1 Tax=Thermomonospora echinospora TaxID=1992 RepID=A0A1H5Z0T4_9ACTN|nr:hypothetical protein SAMN04489712_104285 [Thermomonospora echinospora]